jgi:hypothetical protein
MGYVLEMLLVFLQALLSKACKNTNITLKHYRATVLAKGREESEFSLHTGDPI